MSNLTSSRNTVVHQESMALMPWYVNGTLSASEHDMVASHLLRCAACRHESRWLNSLQMAVSENESDEAMQMGLDRAWARIGQAEAPRPSLAGHVRRFGRRLMSALRLPQLTRHQAVMAGSLALVVMLVGAMWRYPTDTAPSLSAPYRTLSSPVVPSASHAKEAHIVVVFAPETTTRRIQALLDQVGAQLLGGPNPEGAYVLSTDEGKRAEVLRRLQGLNEVRFAQPAEGTALERP